MKKSKVVSGLSLLVGLSVMLGSCLNDDTVTAYQQAQKDVDKIEAYLAANPPEAGDILVRDAYSGIRMVITERPIVDIEGENPVPVPPTQQNVIKVGYEGRLLDDGTVFDSDDSFVFTLTTDDAGGEDVIQGWKFALAMMTQGMKATVYIPSGIAYGTKGKGSIPANAVLVFDLDLKEVVTTNEDSQLTSDADAISDYLEDQENIVVHPNRFSYRIQSTGTGPRPEMYDQVSITYTGKLLDGTEFASNLSQGPTDFFSSRPVNYIHGITLGLQLMHEGDKATFYIPSTLAYGPKSQSGIPANSNLIFEVELVKVTPNTQ